MASLVGTTLGRYQIAERLGAGGMGEVYRARDTALNRDVALKVLPNGAADSPEQAERFVREARAIARLTHPNILAIHDFGTDDGTAFAVAELIDGRNLRELQHGRPLSPERAVTIAAAVAEGLGAAHAAGIVHRDVKPDNVMVTRDGLVKVLDFGLACRERPATSGGDDATATESRTLTETGTVLGTAGYMAPEQVRGHPVDHRVDIFALGCVLYELLTGAPPFRRATRADTLAAVLNDEPPPPSATSPRISPVLDQVVARCLAKDPHDRFESARDVAFALRAVSSGSAPAAPAPQPATGRRIAVLAWLAVLLLALAVGVAAVMMLRPEAAPLLPRPLSVHVTRFTAGDGVAPALAAGVAEELARGLTALEPATGELAWVLPSAQAKDRDPAEVPALHRTYNFGAVVGGRLALAGDVYTIGLRLVDPATAQPSRQGELELPRDDLSRLPRTVLGAALELLSLAGVDSEAIGAAAATTTVTAAQRAYLEGVGGLLTAADAAQVAAARVRLAEAVRRDPQLARARLALARAEIRLFDADADPAHLVAARDAAEPLLAIPAAAGGAALVVATACDRAGDAQRAVEVLDAARRTAPDDADLQLALGMRYVATGATDDATVRAAEQALHRVAFLRPGYWIPHHYLAALEMSRGQLAAAADEFRRITAMAPGYDGGYSNLGALLDLLGRPADARAAFEEALRLEPSGNSTALTNLGNLAFQQGHYSEAIGYLEQAIAIKDDNYDLWGNLAWAYLYGADPHRARAPFERAVALAEAELEDRPNDPMLLATIGGYYAGLEVPDRSRSFVDSAIRANPVDSSAALKIAETFEDLGERDLALDWIGRALDLGAEPRRFEQWPALRDLVADPRYRGHRTGRFGGDEGN